jgi:hypothetical protein
MSGRMMLSVEDGPTEILRDILLCTLEIRLMNTPCLFCAFFGRLSSEQGDTSGTDSFTISDQMQRSTYPACREQRDLLQVVVVDSRLVSTSCFEKVNDRCVSGLFDSSVMQTLSDLEAWVARNVIMKSW